MNRILTAIAAAAMALTAQAAAAATSFSFSFSGTTADGGTLSGNGVFGTDDGVADATTPGQTNFTIGTATGSIQLPNATFATILGVVPNSGATDLIVADDTGALLVDTLLSTTFGNFLLQLNPTIAGRYIIGFEDIASGDATVAVTQVPEPATWAMLLLGFALTGFALRRRRAGAAFA